MCFHTIPKKGRWSFSPTASSGPKFLCKYLVSVLTSWWRWGGTGLSSAALQGRSCSLAALGYPEAAHARVFCLQKQKNIAGALAFWMANASELLNFIKQDRDLSRITLDAQDVLAHLVQMAFK